MCVWLFTIAMCVNRAWFVCFELAVGVAVWLSEIIGVDVCVCACVCVPCVFVRVCVVCLFV